MDNTIQIFAGNNGLHMPDFYPEDLPIEWQFDYYSSKNRALILTADTDQDLSEILNELNTDFKLVIDISNINEFDKFIKPITQYKDSFILFAKNIEKNLINKIKNYNFCIQTKLKIKNCNNINDLYFNNFAVIFKQIPVDEKQIRGLIEELAQLNANIVLINTDLDNETLEKTKIIIELLSFY